MLTTLPKPPLRPGREAEAELADHLWAAQRAMGAALDDLGTFADRGGDLHGGEKEADQLDAMAELLRAVRFLACRLDRTVTERH